MHGLYGIRPWLSVIKPETDSGVMYGMVMSGSRKKAPVFDYVRWPAPPKGWHPAEAIGEFFDARRVSVGCVAVIDADPQGETDEWFSYLGYPAIVPVTRENCLDRIPQVRNLSKVPLPRYPGMKLALTGALMLVNDVHKR